MILWIPIVHENGYGWIDKWSTKRRGEVGKGVQLVFLLFWFWFWFWFLFFNYPLFDECPLVYSGLYILYQLINSPPYTSLSISLKATCENWSMWISECAHEFLYCAFPRPVLCTWSNSESFVFYFLLQNRWWYDSLITLW